MEMFSAAQSDEVKVELEAELCALLLIAAGLRHLRNLWSFCSCAPVVALLFLVQVATTGGMDALDRSLKELPFYISIVAVALFWGMLVCLYRLSKWASWRIYFRKSFRKRKTYLEIFFENRPEFADALSFFWDRGYKCELLPLLEFLDFDRFPRRCVE